MTASTVTYRERLRAPWWLWAVTAFLVLSLGLAFLVVIGPVGSLALVVAVGALAGWGLRSSGAVVEVRDGQLRAGRARMPVALTGPAVALDAERAAYVRGPGIDASAYHLIRGWVATAVLVEVTDPADPTPYWYVATRHPQELAAALDAARAELPS